MAQQLETFNTTFYISDCSFQQQSAPFTSTSLSSVRPKPYNQRNGRDSKCTARREPGGSSSCSDFRVKKINFVILNSFTPHKIQRKRFALRRQYATVSNTISFTCPTSSVRNRISNNRNRFVRNLFEFRSVLIFFFHNCLLIGMEFMLCHS